MKIRTLSISLITLALCTQAYASSTSEQKILLASTSERAEGQILIIPSKNITSQAFKSLKSTALSTSFNIYDSEKQDLKISIKIDPQGASKPTIIEILDKLPIMRCYFRWDSLAKMYKLDMRGLPMDHFVFKGSSILYRAPDNEISIVEITATPIRINVKPFVLPIPAVEKPAPADSRTARIAAMKAAEMW